MALSALVLAGLACQAPVRKISKPAPPTIPVSTEAVQSLEQTVKTVATQVKATGKIQATFTEAQLTSALAMQLKSMKDVPLENPQIRLRDGQIQVSGNARQSGLSVAATLNVAVTVDDQGHPRFKVVDGSLGPFPLPQSLQDEMTAKIDEQLNDQLGSEIESMFIENIIIADGQMVIQGHTR